MDNQCKPNLSLDRVLALPVEAFDAEVLFYHFEEEFHAGTLFICMGKVRPRDMYADTGMVQVVVACNRFLDCAQAFLPGKLGNHHRVELGPGRKMPVAFVRIFRMLSSLSIPLSPKTSLHPCRDNRFIFQFCHAPCHWFKKSGSFFASRRQTAPRFP